MLIFDNFERTNSQPSKYHENSYQYLNEGTGELNEFIRELIEKWFYVYSSTVKEPKSVDLKKRLQSDKPDQHIAAFFELYLFTLLHKSGFEIEVEPPLKNGRHIDFLVTNPKTRDQFYLEATTISEGEVNNKREAAINIVKDRINEQIKSPEYAINLRWFGHCQENDISKKIVKEINEWIKDPQSGYEKLFESWQLQLKACRVSKPYERIIASSANIKPQSLSKKTNIILDEPIESRMDTVKLIRDKLKEKTKYGNLEKPYIIAINMISPCYFFDSIDLIEAIFGSNDLMNGFWLNNYKVSNIIGLFYLTPFNMIPQSQKYWPIIAINPNAKYQFPFQEIPRLPIKIKEQNAFYINQDKLNNIMELEEKRWKKACDTHWRRK